MHSIPETPTFSYLFINHIYVKYEILLIWGYASWHFYKSELRFWIRRKSSLTLIGILAPGNGKPTYLYHYKQQCMKLSTSSGNQQNKPWNYCQLDGGLHWTPKQELWRQSPWCNILIQMLFTNAASIYYFVVCQCANLQIWCQVVGTKPILYRVAIIFKEERLADQTIDHDYQCFYFSTLYSIWLQRDGGKTICKFVNKVQ